MANFDELLARLLREPIHARGRDFERLCKWYLRHDPAYRRQLRHVWLWEDWPGRWGADAGIDLVAETHDGKLWAIQAKAYDPKYRVTRPDVNTFLAESGRGDPKFSYRLLIATTNRIAKSAQQVMDTQRTPVGVLNLYRLEQADVRWPRSLKTLAAKPAPPKKPRPHQKRAISDVLKGLRKADRGQLIMACGTGKTLVALWTAERMRSQRTLILLPSLSLLSQTLREWNANASRRFEFLPVCSDATVAESDQMVASVSELGFPATTDAKAVAAFLRKRGPRVVFSTYQSSPVLRRALKVGRTPGFDLAIADEAHRCAGTTSSEFATVLDPKAIRARRRLFMTATPRIYSEGVRKRALDEDFEIASMDDEAVFGRVLHRLKFSEAISRNLLSDYQVAIVGVDDETYRGYARRGTFVTTDGKRITDARNLATKIALTKATRRYNLRRTISFHSRVAAAREFSRTFPDVVQWMPPRERPSGKLWADYVSGAMPTGKRDNLLGQFRGLGERERGLLSNARCLGEGVDVPTLDGVVFVDPRQSEVDIVQAVGRAIRKSAGKEVGTIVLPVFLSHTDRPEIALDQSEFKPIWDVLKALRSHDDDLAEELDVLRRELGRRGERGVRAPAKIHFDLPKRVGDPFVRAFQVRLVEQSTENWEYWYGLLQRFVDHEGHARVFQSDVVDGSALGKWVARQRWLQRSGRLDTKRARLLDKLPGWIWEPHQSSWETGMAHLWAFARRNGHARVPDDHVVEQFQLGNWVGANRRAYFAATLSERRIRQLEAVPGWTWDAKAAAWDIGFERLQSFVEREGHARVPRGHIEDGFGLARWVVHQRELQHTGQLHAERVRKLEHLGGWTWHPRLTSWNEGLSRLWDFAKREGHARVPSSHVEDGFRLGQWVTKKRSTYRAGKLSGEQIVQLQSLPGWAWNSIQAAWDDGLADLVLFVKREGHARVPQGHVEGTFNLGDWVARQREAFRSNKLDPDRATQLKSLAGWVWDPNRAAWERGFSAVRQYAKRVGHTRIPQKHVENGFRVGAWVNEQRGAYREGSLDRERARRLEALPGWEWRIARQRKAVRGRSRG